MAYRVRDPICFLQHFVAVMFTVLQYAVYRSRPWSTCSSGY